VADPLSAVFGLVCGQEPAHTWAPGGMLLPFCQRCAGFYGGAAVALVLHLALRIRPTARFLQVHGGFLLLMIPLGYHWVPQDALVRTMSGVLFGAGVVSFLWLLPGPHAGGTRVLDRRGTALYAVGVAMALMIIPAGGAWGGVLAWRLLVALASVGLAGLAALALANVALGLAVLLARLRRRASREARP
jgi:uncharacterized membrane protein